jgi:hypothetical protein
MRAALALPLLLGGCHLVLPHQPGAERSDLRPHDRLVLDAEARGERALDSSLADRPPRQGCLTADADTLAVYTFDDPTSPYLDSTGKHPIATTVGLVTTGIGASGCGTGVYLQPKDGLPSYLVIDHDSDWDKVQAIELWVRFDRDPPVDVEAILSRDAAGQKEPGHLTLFRDCLGRLLYRLQQTGSEVLVCSAVEVPKGAWVQVVVNFHPPELRVGGSSASASASTCAAWLPATCSSPGASLGLEGNQNPWVVGASLISATAGTTDVVNHGMEGTIDELRFSSVRR